MTSLSVTERADLQAEFTDMLVDTCYILRGHLISDNEGGLIPDPANPPTQTGPYACAYGPLGTTEGPRGVQIAADATAQIALPAGTDVLGTDQIVVHLDGLNVTVLTCEVKAVARMGQELWRIVQVEETNPV